MTLATSAAPAPAGPRLGAGSAVWRLTLAFAAPLIVGETILATGAFVLMKQADTDAVQRQILDDAQRLGKQMSWRPGALAPSESQGADAGAAEGETTALVQSRMEIRASKQINQARTSDDRKAMGVIYRYEINGKLIKGDEDFVISSRPWCPWWSIRDIGQCFGRGSPSARDGWFSVETGGSHRTWGLARRLKVTSRPEDGYVYVGRPFTLGAVERELFTIAGWALLGALVSLAIGFLVSRAMLRRVEAVNAVCDRVVRGDWGARAAGAEAEDEFGALSRHVNGMLEHIDALVLGMSDVSDVIAHDLRTPIARLKTALEDAAAAPTLEAARAGAEAAADEAGEILVTFQALLDINEAEAGGDGRLQPMRLDETARSIVNLYDPLAEAAGVRLVCVAEPASMLGKPPQIERLAANLLDNAIKFSPPGGEVRVSVEHRGGEVILRVADQGPGIPASEREAVMGRRVRGDGARATPGHGVGLGIVKAVAVGHGSKWRMDDAEPGLIVSIPFKAF